MCVEGENSPVAWFVELLNDEWIFPVGGGAKVAAEFYFWMIVDQWRKKFTFITGQQGAVIADQFGQ